MPEFVFMKVENGQYLQKNKLWKCCMSDEDESATAFVMQWRWPIKHKTLLSVMRYTVIQCSYNMSPAAGKCVQNQLQHTVGHFVWSDLITDHWSLQSCSRSALVAKTKIRRPKILRPLEAFHTTSSKLSEHISSEYLTTQKVSWALRWNCRCPIGLPVSGAKCWATVSSFSRTITAYILSGVINDEFVYLTCSYLWAHTFMSVQNVDLGSDKTDKPNESPSCFGLEEKT